MEIPHSGRHIPQVMAYTGKPGHQAVAFNVLKGRSMGGFFQLHAGYGAGFIPGAQQQPQGPAAGAQVQDSRLFGQPYKVGQDHGIGA